MSSRLSSRLLIAVMLGMVAVPFFLRLRLIPIRGFNPDELECIHWSWCVSKGLVPYRDYFDHHTPWMHFFLSFFFPFYDVERVPGDAIAFLFMARRWTWLFAGCLLAMTFVLARALRDGRTALLSVLLLSNAGFFLAKSLEVRADVPASALLLASVYLSLAGIRRSEGALRGADLRLLASGLAIGAAVMLTQKVLFAGPGFAAASIWLLADRRLSAPPGRRLRLAVLQTLGFLAPVGATLAYFAAKGAAWDFVDANFLVNARWPGLGARDFVVELARQDPIYVLLGCAGLSYFAVESLRAEGARRAAPVAAFPLISLVATLPFHTGMSYQHFLLILPLFSICAASCLSSLADLLASAVRRQPARDLALLVAVLLLSVVPLARFRAAFDRGNWGTLQGIEYVLRNTSPRETTFDGFTGLGLFRPQAFYHHFQHPHAFALQTEEEHQEMLDALRTGRALPKMIFWSRYLREAVTPEMAAFLAEHYVPSGIEPIRIRPFDNGVGFWSDEAPRYLGWDPESKPESPHVFFDDGWRPPSYEFGAEVRRTRTRRSGLVVPIRRPRDFQVVLRAHADLSSGPFGVELVVNGASAGVVEAVPRWQDYTFFVEVRNLRPGFNQFELRFSSPNDTPDRRFELAASTLQLRASEREPFETKAVDGEERTGSAALRGKDLEEVHSPP